MDADSAIAQSVLTNGLFSPRNSFVSESDVPSEPTRLNVDRNSSLRTPTSQQSNQQSSPWGDEPHTGSSTSTDARGNCPGVSTPLVALMPDINYGRSVSSTPTLWFYVPYDSETISRGEFVLQDEDHNNVIEPQAFTLSNTPGFVSLMIPSSESPLKTNQSYHWFFELYCEEDSSSPVYVEGWIEKTPLDGGPGSSAPFSPFNPLLDTQDFPPQTPLNGPQHLYSLYQQNSIWFDAVNILIKEWSESPDDALLRSEVLSLLQSANVDINPLPETTTFSDVRYD